MSFNIELITQEMIGAARDTVQERWPQIETMAEVELRRLAGSMEDLGRLVAEGKIDVSRARQHAHIHQITARSVLATTEGLGLRTADQAVTAAIRAVTKLVNGALKFALL